MCLAFYVPCASRDAFVLELVHGLDACRIPFPAVRSVGSAGALLKHRAE